MRSAFASSSDDDDDDWGEVPPRVQRIDWIPTPSPVQRNMSSPVQRRMSSPVQRNSGSSRIADWKLSVPAFDNLDKFEPWKDEQVYGWIIHSTSANKRDGEYEWLNYKCGVHANCSARVLQLCNSPSCKPLSCCICTVVKTNNSRRRICYGARGWRTF